MKETITHYEGDELRSTLGELRRLVEIADGIGAPDESDIYVTVQADGATRHGSRLRTVTIAAPGMPS